MKDNIELVKSIDIKTIISEETGLRFRKNFLESCPFCDSGKSKGGKSSNAGGNSGNSGKSGKGGKGGNSGNSGKGK